MHWHGVSCSEAKSVTEGRKGRVKGRGDWEQKEKERVKRSGNEKKRGKYIHRERERLGRGEEVEKLRKRPHRQIDTDR